MALHHRYTTGDLRCFICDEIITGTCLQLVVGVTPYSKTDLPTKIGQLMGEGFMVVVSEDDNLCKRCTSLLHELDRLEVDLNLVKDALTNYLKMKYQLHEEDHLISTCRDETVFHVYNEEENDSKKYNRKALYDKEGVIISEEKFKDGCENIPEILSSGSESSKKLNVEIILDGSCGKKRKKKRKATDATRVLNGGHSSSTNKEHKCSLCGLITHDISVYKAHSCSESGGIICDNDYEGSRDIQKYVKNGNSVEWICHICNKSFKEENMFASHTQTHSHKDKLQSKLQNGKPITKKTNILISGVYTCNICNFKTENAVTYRDHHQAHFENLSEYRSLQTNIQKGSYDHKSSLYKAGACSVDTTGRVSEKTLIQEDPTCNLQTCIETDSIKDSGSNIIPAENKGTAGINCKVTESLTLSTNERIPNSEHYFCSSCSLVFSSDVLFQHHKNTHHTLPSLRKDSVLSTEITSNNFCDLLHKDCLDTNKSSNLNITDENFTDILKKVSTRFMQVANRKYNDVYGNELTSEHGPGRVASNSTTCTKVHCDSSQLTAGKIDYIASAKTEQHSVITHNSISEKLEEPLLSAHGSHSSETSQKDNNFPCDFAINKFITSGRTHTATKEKENSEENINYNSSLVDLQGVSYRDVQRNALRSENGTECTRQKVDNENSQLVNFGTRSYQSQNMKNLRTPLVFHGTQVETPQCENCGKFFSSNGKLLYHRDICLQNLSCKLCSKHFLNITDVQKHYSENHHTPEMINNCMHCSMPFLTKELCQSHEENCEFAPHCDECGEIFSKVDELRSHKDTNHRDPHCRYCGKEILKLKTLRNHEMRHVKESEERFECSECDKVFKTKTGLRHHFALHTGQYKFCCDYCGRGFMSRMMMEEHISKHTKEERYTCDVCGRKFCFQSTYWIHRKWHDNPFPYKCNFCGRKFRHSSLLAVHKRKHTGERPYKCPHCPLTFPVGGTLKRHIILHTKVYPYNCEVCKRGFTTRHKFALHLSKTHGDSKMLNEKLQPNEFKMVIRDEETVKRQDNLEPSADWQNADDSEQVDMNFRLGGSARIEDNFEHLEGAMSCSLVPDELLVGNVFATRVVEIVLDDTSQAVAAVTVADPEANSLPDMWYE